jgi:L-lactate dehydrogenase
VAGTPIFALLARLPDHDLEKFRRDVGDEVRYANISIIEGIGASQHGIGMVTARIAEIIARDERVVIPIGYYNPKYGVTLSLPSIVGRQGVLRTIETGAVYRRAREASAQHGQIESGARPTQALRAAAIEIKI